MAGLAGRSRSALPVGVVLVLPAFLLGVAAVTQIQTQARRAPFISSYTSQESAHLTQIALAMQREQEDLKRQLLEARAALDAVQEEGAGLSVDAATLQRQIDDIKAVAGLTSLSGAGVIVTLDDARLPPSVNHRLIALAIVHSEDITDVLNAAWKGGAQGVAINGERITGASACVGATIQINGTLLSPPFVVSIVGPTDELMRVLGDPGELADLRARQRAFGLHFDVAAASEVRLPAYAGPLAIRYAHVN